MLGLCEAMDLVEEQECWRPTVTNSRQGGFHHLTYILDTRRDGGKLHELSTGRPRNDMSNCGFPGSRGSPQNYRDPVYAGRLGKLAQGRTDAQQVRLTDNVVDGTRTHTHGERGRATEKPRFARHLSMICAGPVI
ncbi:unannotated protein [freshwater metagenome]|uniref:Unannotated protein n=1 Tax=freshwater metagenome TaxID=449393 RepID=A0A6J6II34_9ZZZZ